MLFDDIVLEDRSETTFEFHLAGPNAEELIRISGGQLPEPGELAHVATALADCPLLIVRESPTGRPGLTLIGARGSAAKVAGLLRSQGHDLGLAELDLESFEVLRIEAGTPVFGRDVTEKNLPQEIGRDDAGDQLRQGLLPGPGDGRADRRAGPRQPDSQGAVARAPSAVPLRRAASWKPTANAWVS